MEKVNIGVVLEGQLFARISNYYNYEHERKARISVSGFLNFLEVQIGQELALTPGFARITSAHYWRGRAPYYDYDQRDVDHRVKNERIFDDILMDSDLEVHYVKIQESQGRYDEREVEIKMLLDTLERAFTEDLQVIVLCLQASRYVSLIKKLQRIGKTVVVLSWSFSYVDDRNGREYRTEPSKDMEERANIVLNMSRMISKTDPTKDNYINSIFIKDRPETDLAYKFHNPRYRVVSGVNQDLIGQQMESYILSMKEDGHYGFIAAKPDNIYFHVTGIKTGYSWSDLTVDGKVKFTIQPGESPGKLMATEIVPIY